MPVPRLRAALQALPLSIVVLAGVVAPAERSRAADTKLPSLVAEHFRHHVPSGTELVRVRIELSPDGFRATERANGRQLEIVQDFVAERLWFVDRRRRVAHEVDLDELASGASEPNLPAASGLLDTTPCAGGVARSLGDAVHHGRAPSPPPPPPPSGWECRSANGERIALEWMDVALGIVVRRRTPDGIVDELRDIRELAFGAGHFSPSSRFRDVDERELVRGAPALAAFDEVPEDERTASPPRTSGHASRTRERTAGDGPDVL